VKVSKEMLSKIISEERVRAVVESKLPWSQTDFFLLLNEARWWEKLDPKSTAYKIAVAAGREWDEASEKAMSGGNPKRMAMTKEDYMKQSIYDNAKAGHKFSRWNSYEEEGTLPNDDTPRSMEEIIRKGYPEEGLVPRKTTPDMELRKKLSDVHKDKYPDLEIEAWISPFGYIHAKVPDYDMRRRRMLGGYMWVYTGDYFPNVDTGQPELMKWNKEKKESYGYPEVTGASLRLEKEVSSPDARAMSGNDTEGSIDIQDPTMEERLTNAIKEEIANMNKEA
jgi:hypothetical protein